MDCVPLTALVGAFTVAIAVSYMFFQTIQMIFIGPPVVNFDPEYLDIETQPEASVMLIVVMVLMCLICCCGCSSYGAERDDNGWKFNFINNRKTFRRTNADGSITTTEIIKDGFRTTIKTTTKYPNN